MEIVDAQIHLWAKGTPSAHHRQTPFLKDEALAAIAGDDMGRDALKGGLKKAKITNSDSTSMASNWAKFASGELTLDHKPLTNIGEIDQRAKSLQKVLENGL